ncbi:MAG: hypothetical protein MJZ46_07070, partial [Bacteroidales bacterium]|nr:hypothetical protein [Bacteroidales bacterium]
MAEGRKIPRLGKAAGEFNVAIGTITALLKKKNFDIAESPNSKLTEEMYDILIKEFQGEKLVKEESKKIEIGTFKKDEEVIDTPQPADVPEEEPQEEAIFIKKVNVMEPEPVVIPVGNPQPKIIGKIDIEPKKKTSAKKAATTANNEEETVQATAEPEVTTSQKNTEVKQSESETEAIPQETEQKTVKEIKHIDTVVEPLKDRIVTVGKI